VVAAASLLAMATDVETVEVAIADPIVTVAVTGTTWVAVTVTGAVAVGFCEEAAEEQASFWLTHSSIEKP
jgi:2',3'-cyclic-nucleotide 2'-phosphodiesterase (5'-nucleotidase family)